MNYPINDPYFRVELLHATKRPNLLCYLAMHQDYSEGNVYDDIDKLSKLSEAELGDRIVNKCIKFGHWGILEHPSISLNVIGFPHSVMVQARTHRVGITFDVQSQRYTGNRMETLRHKILNQSIDDKLKHSAVNDIEKVLYYRPTGQYQDRNGNNYDYTKELRDIDINDGIRHILDYSDRIAKGFAPEHARDMLCQNIRQNFVVTFNARSLLHFCDLRLPKDAQPEIRTMAQMVFDKFSEWMPEIAEWYTKHRYEKSKLAP